MSCRSIGKIALLCGVCVGLSVRALWADVVELKSGEFVSGSVIVESEEYVIVQLQKASVAKVIEKKDITSIRREAAVEGSGLSQRRNAAMRDDLRNRVYVDEEYGFYMKGPEGWFRHLSPPIRGVRVLFNTSESPKRIFPGVAVSIDALDDAGVSLSTLAEDAIARQQGAGNTLIKPAEPFTTDGSVHGIRFVTQSGIGDYGFSFTFMHCMIQKDARIYSLMCAAQSSEFERYLNDFDLIINSFEWLDI